MPAGEWCEGDGSCGTDDSANDCFLWEEIYVRVDCVLTPPSPPPPMAPRPPASPGESAYMPAPPPPADLSGLDQEQRTDSGGVFGPITLPWLIVIILLSVCIPALIIVLFCYLCPGRCACFCNKASEPPPAALPDLGYGGTLVIDDAARTMVPV